MTILVLQAPIIIYSLLRHYRHREECMKRWLLSLGMLSALTSAYAGNPLGNYQELSKALQQGDDVVGIVHFDNCKTSKPSPVNQGASTRVNFTIFSNYKVPVNGINRMTIATSYSMLTEHRDLGTILVFGRLRIFEDNSSEFHVAYYDAKTHELKNATDYTCEVGTAAASGITLIDKNN